MAKIDMTKGDISHNLVAYAIPLILGNLFQLTYNVIDSVIAGQFIGKEALAAEGIAAPFMNILILGISGLSLGAGILMSELFGAKDYKKLKKELATILIMGSFLALVIMIGCFLGMDKIIVLLNVPASITTMTTIYLKIILLGAPFTFFYNTLAQALKSVGDFTTALKFLMFSSILNGLLDLIFIGYLGFGIVCSATTTVIAEMVSVILLIIYIYKKVDELALRKEDVGIDKELLVKTWKYSSLTALQQTIQPVGKLLIQGCVNSLGVDVVAAFNACTRVDDYAFTIEQSIAHGITIFVSQNRGKLAVQQEKEEKEKTLTRLHKGFAVGLKLEVSYWLILCVLTLCFKKVLMGLFVDASDPASALVINLGVRYLTTMAFCYLLPALTNGVQGFFRGYGQLGITVISTFIQASLRVLGTYLLTPYLSINGIPLAASIGWCCMLLFEVPYYFYFKKKTTLN